jgi:hypothetical protein
MKRKILDFSAVAAVALALGASVARANSVYDSTFGAGGAGTAGLLFTTNNPNASFGDDLTLDPSLAVGDRVVRGVNFAFVVPANVTVPDSDAIVTFYDTEDGTAAGTTVALTNPLGAARVHIGAIASAATNRGFTTGFFDIQDQTAGGVAIPDGVGGVSIRFVATGTNDILPGTTITPGLSTGTVGVGSNVLTYIYLDGFAGAPLDGSYTGAERVGFGGANANNNKLWLQLDNVPEPGSIGMLLVGVAALARARRR